MRIRSSRLTDNVTSATIDTGKDEPQTTVTFRVWEGGCDLLVFFTPWPRQGQRTDDRADAVRLA